MCERCRSVYDSSGWEKLKGAEHSGPAPRFAGLCMDCKAIAAGSVPIIPDNPPKAVDEIVEQIRRIREKEVWPWPRGNDPL